MIQSLLARRLVYPLHERLLKRPTFDYLRELDRSQWLSREDMEQLQEKKLTALLQSAFEHCPWHRERMMATGIDPRETVSLADLRRLPVMDKQNAVEHGADMVWHGVPGGAYQYNTG